MKAIFAAGLLALSAPLWATTYYVSNCADGAAPACVVGNDANPGTSPSAPKQSIAAARDLINAAQPGDQVLFARGGGWINAHMTLVASHATPEQPVVVGAYAPPWCTGTCASARPVLTEARPFGNGQPGNNDNALLQLRGGTGGYVFKDLELRGGRDETWGIFITERVHDVTIQNLAIRDFSIGVYCGNANPRVQLLESTITGNYEQGTLWGCVDSLIENNTFDNNGYKKILASDGSVLHGRLHNIYIGLESVDGKSLGGNITVRGNKLTRNALLDGKCDGVSLVVHGAIDGLLIENNLLYEVPDANGSAGCYGIGVNSGSYGSYEAFNNVVIRGNTVVNLPHTAIGCGSCIAPVIENNVIVQEAAMREFYGIVVPDQDRRFSNARSTGAKIRNNSIYVARGVAGTAINLSEYSDNAGSTLEVTNNLIFMAAAVEPGHSCINVGSLALANFTAIDNNLCYHQGGDDRGAWSNRNGKTFKTLADAQKAGFDVHGKSSDPLLAAVPSQANGWSMKVRAGSPAIDAGHTTYKARNSYKGYVRTGAPDIGAYEYGLTP